MDVGLNIWKDQGRKRTVKGKEGKKLIPKGVNT